MVYEPDPAGAESPRGSCRELFLEGIERPKRRVYRIGQGPGRSAAAALTGRRQQLPEERVIEVPPRVVPPRVALVLGHIAQLLHHHVNRDIGQLGALEGL